MEFRSRPDLEAQRLKVEAIGEPGERRFRLLAVVDSETYIIWMEKQQLQALGLALEQMLEQLPDRGPEPTGAASVVEFDTNSRRQFRAGRMELGYDDRQDRIVIVAHDVNDVADSGSIGGEAAEVVADFGCRLTREQAREMSADSAAVVAAGRTRCTMCGAPMGPGTHACPQQNGHFPYAFADTEATDEE